MSNLELKELEKEILENVKICLKCKIGRAHV